MSPMIPPGYRTVADAATIAGYSPEHVSDLIRRGWLQCKMIGGKRFVDLACLTHQPPQHDPIPQPAENGWYQLDRYKPSSIHALILMLRAGDSVTLQGATRTYTVALVDKAGIHIVGRKAPFPLRRLRAIRFQVEAK
jgi:hypothetical protein